MLNKLTVGEFQEGLKSPVKKLTKRELQQREEFWRVLWGWTDDVVKRFLFHIGTQVRLMRRDYKGSFGELGEVKFEPKQIEISVFEKHYDYTIGKELYEKKVILLPWTSVMWLEEITGQKLAEEVEIEEVMPIPETVEEVVS